MSNKMNPGEWTDDEIRRLDFAWSRFIEPFFRFVEECKRARQQGKSMQFQLVDHGERKVG